MDASETSRLSPGQRLSRYEILERLGEGGAGTVYKARDTELDRIVALKVLNLDNLGDRDERFRQEARTASSLNHPHITTVYEIGRHSGAEFIAMEYVPGRTLAALLADGKLPWREAVGYASQIADALVAAHESGIIHRDLKPANVIITPQGVAKVLDFGLAKVTGVAAGDLASTRTMADSPATEAGVLLGTCAYMSPEQAEGQRVDTRSDIFAFGALLYEMLAGRPAFERATYAATLAAVLRDEPAPLQGIPKELEKVVARCLRKAPARRYQHMDDVKVALEEVVGEPATAGLSWQKMALGGVALVLLGIGVWQWGFGRSNGQPAKGDLTRLTMDAGLTTDPAISRDGTLLAYASDRAGNGSLDIWIQQTAGGEPMRLTSDDADERQPSFSPDGTVLAFRSERDGGSVSMIPALGGEVRLLAKSGRDPRFSPDGQRLAYWVGDPHSANDAQVWVAPVNRGEPERIGPDFADARYPLWSPDGTRVVVVGAYQNRGDWWLIPMDGSKPSATGAYQILNMQGFSRDVAAMGALAAPSVWERGAFLFSAVSGDTANLWRAPFSASIGQVTGSAERLTFGTDWESQPSESAGGRIVFSSSAADLDIWSAPLDADAGKVRGEPSRIVEGAARDYSPSLSRDGSRLVYRSNRSGKECIWIKDLATGKEVEHCDERLQDGPPLLSPGGTRVLYRARGRTQVMNTDGSESKTACRGCRAWSWLPDEQRFLMQYGSRRVSVKPVNEGESQEVLRSDEFSISDPRPSPDGKWIAFHLVKSPTKRQVFVAPFRDSDSVREKDWIAVTDDTGDDRSAHWSPDGNLLYFLSARDGFRCVWAQRLDPRTKRPRGEPFAVQHFHHARLSLRNGTDPDDIGLAIAKDRLVVSVFEVKGNIWMLGKRR